MPSVDEVVAASLLRTTRAVRLLGALPVLVGIRAELAQVLAQLDIDLAGVVTLANLQGGIAWALRQRSLTIARLSADRAVPPSRSPAPSPAATTPAMPAPLIRSQTDGN